MKKLLLSLAALASATAASAVPVQWTSGAGGNDHWYEYVGTSLSWTAANAAANAATYFDGSNTLNGYLVTITSSAENSFLFSLASDAWIGASDAGHEGDWRWVGGPEAGQTFWNYGNVTFSSWNSGEPNNAGGEDYAHYQSGAWNDLPNGNNRGYFVEYSGAAAVPEPGMLGLMGLGIAALGVARRRRK